MSDFDKEAEREKLREKYEQDKEERKATQRMSDLLLKGATMTNAHCGTCGDPLFQHEGTTFCPSCHGNPDAVEGTGLEAQSADEQSTAGQPATERSTAEQPTTGQSAAEQPAAGQPATEQPADDGRDRPAMADATTADTVDAADSEAGRAADADGEPIAAGRRRADEGVRQPRSQPSDSSGESRSQSTVTPPSVDADLETARDALVRTLEKFAAEAAAADDPRYARDCLEAAREAGETLSTLR
ncbi:Sjogren's syndrome/scleroderma autoantigen 1 family protein [Natrinema sp. DC36]|uniref:Sjogren's syndrome/scleroderma autoantigen 1 family protein n=1 Tax=Natrinema sp. DC36 TaxID=2878680 RepID=UPI001CF04D49|nr:Sjogren's syndrome/scleroderma autoantigen 1 family protein [Natrinema sp. DC36]